VHLTASGEFRSEFLATGQLKLTPVNPVNGLPSGPEYRAKVEDHQVTSFGTDGGSIEGLVHQMELPQDQPGRGKLRVHLKLVTGGRTDFDQDIRCKGAGFLRLP
jgi:hypothetical protein